MIVLTIAAVLVADPMSVVAQTVIGSNNGSNGSIGTGTPESTVAKNAALAAARGEMEKARSQLTASTEKVRATWKANPQMIAADDAVTSARKDYEAARRAVIARLQKDPAYQAAMKQQTDAQAKLHESQDATAATQPAAVAPGDSVQTAAKLPPVSAETVDLATKKLESKSSLRNLEDTAIANDDNASKAQAKLATAEKEAKVWQLQLDAALKNDPDYRAALEQVQSARQHMAAASAAQN